MNPKKKCKDSDVKAKKRREQKRKSMQRAREKLKNDDILLEAAKAKERQRWHERKQKGSVKTVKELSNREQRIVRKKWRESSRKYRQQKKRETEMQLNTPPDSPPDRMQINPQNEPLFVPSTSRVESGRKVARKNREKLRQNLKNAELRCKKFENKAEKYRKKYHRLLKKIKKETAPLDATPRKTMAPILQSKYIDKDTKRRLFSNEVICQQIKKKFQQEKSRKLKRKWSLILNGGIVKKYRCVNYVENLMSLLSSHSNTPIRRKPIYREVYQSGSSDEEAETKRSPVSGNQNNSGPKLNDFVIVKFEAKKSTHHYVAVVEQIINDDELSVFFLKKSGNAKFSLPEEDKKTLFDVDIEDVCAILDQPTNFHRSTYTFNFDFMQYNMY